MVTDTGNSIEYHHYADFWNDNIRKLDEIHIDLNKALAALEKKYVNFEEVYSTIEKDIEILSSIYAGFNTIKGKEYILRLNTIVQNYKKRYTRDGIDFELLHFLLTKISQLRDESFEQFPLLDHDEDGKKQGDIISARDSSPLEPPDSAGSSAQPEPGLDDYHPYYSRPFKWISFERNGSWFIALFETSVAIVTREKSELAAFEPPDFITVNINNQQFQAKDIFSSGKERSEPELYIVIDNGARVFAASAIGKRIFSKTDILSGRIKPFKTAAANLLSPGRVRIFGRNHILLNPGSPD
ncbi:MAG: hypothetical protein GY754_17310 [bacterium]|nr:hypothetical protein [bacterium]